jgi:hypothetical protein
MNPFNSEQDAPSSAIREYFEPQSAPAEQERSPFALVSAHREPVAACAEAALPGELRNNSEVVS